MAFPPITATVPSLANWQYQFGPLLLGAQQPWGVTSSKGLDLPKLRTGNLMRARDHGEFAGLDLMGGRDIELALVAQAKSSSALAVLLQALSSELQPATSEQPLWLQRPGLPLLAAMVRPSENTAGNGGQPFAQGHLAQPTIGFHATDPRLYTAAQSVTVGVPPPIPGVGFDHGFPFSFGGGSSVATISADNSGTIEMRPLLLITGPVTNPSAANASLSGTPTLMFSNPDQTGFTLNAGDTLLVDLDTHTVVYTASGTTIGSPRRNWVVAGSTWWNLPPGISTIQCASGDASDVAGSFELIWASAYPGI